MSKIILKKNGTDYPLMTMPNHYPADRVYLDGDTTKNVQDAIERGSVSVTADGSKTYETLLNELYSALDISKITPKSALQVYRDIYSCIYIGSSNVAFGLADFNKTNGKAMNSFVNIQSSGSSFYTLVGEGTTPNNYSQQTLSNGRMITLYY